jgi:ArsR family transcriptional regulator, arsenate/arsenite/antimonite-responsive transcriptional repressor
MRDHDFQIEEMFKALADRTRLRVIHLLGTDEVCVCSVVQALRTSQPKVSRHLAYLRRAGLVSARREGKWMHYRIVEPADPQAAEILRALRNALAQNPQMKRDRERLASMNGGSGVSAT